MCVWQIGYNSNINNLINQKIHSNRKLSIILAGDSIGAGAQTIGQYYFDDSFKTSFFSLLKSFLENTYHIKTTARSLAVSGAGAYSLNNNLNIILSFKPDIVLIEFGMNDHNKGSGMTVESYSYTIEQAIRTLKTARIEVVLVGFFRQNPKWDLEDIDRTILFNNVLRNLASKYGLFFADIDQAFQQVKNKDIYEDIMADYIHHPTDFGHQIYFSTLIPAFIIETVDGRQIRNYINLNF